MTKRAALRTLVVTLATGAGLLTTSSAFAIAVPGIAGISNFPSCATFLATGQYVNGCNFSVEYYLPLPANSGSKSVKIVTNNSGTGPYSCNLISMGPSGGTAVMSGVFPNTGNQTNTLTGNLASNASMFLDCTIPPNGAFTSFNYNP